jgi:hypothetical protein
MAMKVNGFSVGTHTWEHCKKCLPARAAVVGDLDGSTRLEIRHEYIGDLTLIGQCHEASAICEKAQPTAFSV